MTTLLSYGGRPCACPVALFCSYYSIFVAFWAFDCTDEQCREGPIDIKTGIKTGVSVQQCIVSRRKPQLYMRCIYFPLLIGRKIRRPHLVRDKAAARRPCDLCGRRHVPLLRTGMCGGKRSHAGRPAAKTLGASASASCAADAAERACRHKKGAVTASCFYTISLQPLFHLELTRVRSVYFLQEEPHAVGNVEVNRLTGCFVFPVAIAHIDVRMCTCAKALDLESAVGEEPAL